MYDEAGYCGALLLLAVLAGYDIRWRKIPIVFIVTFGIAAILYFFAGYRVTVDRVIFCMGPGVLILLLAFVTKEKIGYGDGMTILILGFFLGGFLCLTAVGLGIMLTGIGSLYQIMRKSREPVPLIPFMLAALEVILFYV